MRLDQYLVEMGAHKSRHRAQIEIKAARIIVNGEPVIKPSYTVKEDDHIVVLEPYNPYVSQGGLKLEHALQIFNLSFKDKTVLDIGASTGGFTDCALKHGAKKVYAIDVGTAQLDVSLRDNPQVISIEKTNFLDIKKHQFEDIDYIVMDVSFVSGLSLIFHANMLYEAPIIWLIKPQFETLKTPKSGVIKNPKLHFEVLESIQKRLNQHQLYIQHGIPSPIKGQNGNIEFLSLIDSTKHWIDIAALIEKSRTR